MIEYSKEIQRSRQLGSTSTNGAYLAAVTNTGLQVYTIPFLESFTTRSLTDATGTLGSVVASSLKACCTFSHSLAPKWAAPFVDEKDNDKSILRHRIAVVLNEYSVMIFDLMDAKWSMTINHSAVEIGKLVHVNFGGLDRYLITLSEPCTTFHAWTIPQGKRIDIKDPKYSNSRTYSIRPYTYHLAILTRPNSQDIITLHAPFTLELIKTVYPPTTDAVGVKWSPDARWLAVWDSATYGTRIHLYTSDGNLYKSFLGKTDDAHESLGVKFIQWSPTGNFLGVSTFIHRLIVLNTRTFSPFVYLDHTSQVHIVHGVIWIEKGGNSGSLNQAYWRVQKRVTLPRITKNEITSNQSLSKQGISHVEYNSDGSLVATVDASFPSTIWIWHIRLLKPLAIFIQHFTLRKLSWHPLLREYLLIQCQNSTEARRMVYIWKSGDVREGDNEDDNKYDAESIVNAPPFVITVPNSFYPGQGIKSTGQLEVNWVNTLSDSPPTLLLSHNSASMIVQVKGNDEFMQFNEGVDLAIETDNSTICPVGVKSA